MSKEGKCATDGPRRGFVKRIARLMFWLVAVCLLLVWFWTAIETWRLEKRLSTLVSIIVVGITLFLLFLLEGYESAYGDLRDKDSMQVSEGLRDFLVEMQKQDRVFIGQRELFVVVGITLITLATSFRYIVLPFLGRVETHGIPGAFGLVFTSLMVFWFASVASKMLALENPQAFLKCCKPLWRLIKKPGWDSFLAPSETIVAYISRKSPFNKKQKLAPSRPTFYDSSLRRYGKALDSFRQEIVIKRDGSCAIKARGLLWITHGEWNNFKGHINLDKQNVALEAQKTPVKVLTGPDLNGSREQAYRCLDGLFETGSPGMGIEVVEKVKGQLEPTQDERGLLWTIHTTVDLPEGLAQVSGQGNLATTADGALVFYEVEARSKDPVFDLGKEQDGWMHTLDCPCRKYSLTITLEADADEDFAVPKAEFVFEDKTHLGETKRLSDALRYESKNLRLNLDYPLTGGTVKLSWHSWLDQSPSGRANGPSATPSSNRNSHGTPPSV